MRYNYASAECGARILRTSKDTFTPHTVLSSSKDSYMLSPCSVSGRFVIIELCQDIRIDRLIIANYEYFSSTFERVKLSVAKRYAVGGDGAAAATTTGSGDEDGGDGHLWINVGEWAARAGRGEQTFAIDRPAAKFTRFIKIDLIGRHESAYYCPVTYIKVYGKTMLEEFEEESRLPRHSSDDHGGSDRALVSVAPSSSRHLQLALLMEHYNVSTQTCSPLLANTKSHYRGDGRNDNIYKAIHERLCRLEEIGWQTGQLKSKLDSLARIVIGMASREHQHHAALQPKEPFCISRCEFYAALGVFAVLVLALCHLVCCKRGGPRRGGHLDGEENTGYHRAEATPLPLDLPNSDYLGLLRTPATESPPHLSPPPPPPHHRTPTSSNGNGGSGGGRRKRSNLIIR